MIKTAIASLWNTTFGKAIIFAVGLLAPIKFIMILVFMFILVDTIGGIWASNKLGIEITSRRLSKFISKLLVYQSVIILAYAIDVNLLGEFILLFLSVPLALTKVVGLGLVVNETYSLDESLKKVNKDKGLAFYFKQLLGVAKKIKSDVDDSGLTK